MTTIMRNAATKRADSKQESQDRILDAAARRLREEGLTGAGIAAVMRDAGLTHGAFYSHFGTKDELAGAAFAHAIGTGRPSPDLGARSRSPRASCVRTRMRPPAKSTSRHRSPRHSPSTWCR